MPASHDQDYVLPSCSSESARLERQGRLYGGTDFLEPFLDEAPARVLDVGCGTGFFTRHVAERLVESEVVGVDMDEGRLTYAQKQGRHSNLRFERGDLTDLPFPDDAFDLVFCRFVLVHAPDPALFLTEMSRVARPGGRVVAYEMVHDGIWFSPEKQAFSQVLAEAMRVMRERDMGPSQGLHLGPAMVRAELAEVRVEVVPHACMAGESAFEAYRQNWLDTVSGLDEILGQAFDRSLLERAVEELSDPRPDQFLVELTVLASGGKKP
ncbi:MAG: methyltransferase domain-containing protein [Deltaproteobacteria bacterium]|nr:methyltransferase domain-containing protein [Deltaproteobacteria bacterium]